MSVRHLVDVFIYLYHAAVECECQNLYHALSMAIAGQPKIESGVSPACKRRRPLIPEVQTVSTSGDTFSRKRWLQRVFLLRCFGLYDVMTGCPDFHAWFRFP